MSPLPHSSNGSSGGPDSIAVVGESIRPIAADIQKREFRLDPPSLIRWYTLFNQPVGRAASVPTLPADLVP